MIVGSQDAGVHLTVAAPLVALDLPLGVGVGVAEITKLGHLAPRALRAREEGALRLVEDLDDRCGHDLCQDAWIDSAEPSRR